MSAKMATAQGQSAEIRFGPRRHSESPLKKIE